MRTEPSKEENLLLKYTAKPLIINEVEQRLQNDGRLGINIGIQEGLVLKTLCSLNNVEKVVEIGTQYGCSAAWMAQTLGKAGQLYTLERDPQCIENSQKTFQQPDFVATGCHVELIEGDALEGLQKIENKGPFDMVFIDANKSGYGDYLDWARRNIRSGGIIAIDNIYLFGSVFMDECPEKTPKKMWNVMNAVIEKQLTDKDYSTCIVPTTEGLMISVLKS